MIDHRNVVPTYLVHVKVQLNVVSARKRIFSEMNLLSPGDIIQAVRRRSVCSVAPVVLVANKGDDQEGSLSKKEKKRRSSLTEQSPTRKASFFQR